MGQGLARASTPQSAVLAARGASVGPWNAAPISRRCDAAGRPAAAPPTAVRRCTAARRRVPHRARLAVAASSSAAPADTSTAIVIGAGLAGLTAAAALRKHFDRVVVLERDAWDGEDTSPQAKRPGVGQFHQPHVLLARGLQALDEVVGGYSGALAAAGGYPVTFTSAFHVYDWGTDFMQSDSELRGVLGTRALYESTARALVAAQEGVELRPSSAVESLVWAEAGGKPSVAGVRLRDGSTLGAALVVDCSGRSSRTAEWLEAAGLGRPRELVCDSKAGYGTRLYSVPEGYSGLMGAIVGGRPSGTRVGIMLPVEGRRWQLILCGYSGDHPPADEGGYNAYLKSLGSPVVAQMLEGATPLTPVSRYNGTRNQRRLYEKIDMPEGLVVLGDAVCCYNPIYGQGITTGVLQSEQLGRLLEQRRAAAGGDLAAALRGLPNVFQRQVAGVVAGPWQLAISEDGRFASTEANFPIPATATLLRPYFAALAQAASRNPGVMLEWARVLHMEKGVEAFFAPGMLATIWYYAWLLPQLARLPLVGGWAAAALGGGSGSGGAEGATQPKAT